MSARGASTAPTVATVAASSAAAGTSDVAQRSDQWLACRAQKLASLRALAENCSFTPRLYRPERSPRWLAGPCGGTDLHQRAMRRLQRRQELAEALAERIREEELRQCSFTPDLSGSWPPSVAVPPTRRPCPCGPGVSRERAHEFYEEQMLWREAKDDIQKQQREEKLTLTLEAEELACRLTPHPRKAHQGTHGPNSSAYERQVLWMRQRDFEVEELRQMRFEELTGRKRPVSAGDRSRCRFGAEAQFSSGSSLRRSSSIGSASPRQSRQVCQESIGRIRQSFSNGSASPRHAHHACQAHESAGSAILYRLRTMREQPQAVR